MKTINEYFSQSEKISSIDEYLLSKKNKEKTIDQHAYNDLVDKLYDKLGKEEEFENIKKNGTFSTRVYGDESIDNMFPDIAKIAKKRKGRKQSFDRYTWKLTEILDLYGNDYDKVYSLILKWFDYLL